MCASQLKKRFIAGFIVCAFLAFWLGSSGEFGFNPRWRKLRDGMTQQEVREALGPPTFTGQGDAIGAGNQPLTRWDYKRGRSVYRIDFDYIGPGGAPVVYRTEHFREERSWPWWWPWRPALARA